MFTTSQGELLFNTLIQMHLVCALSVLTECKILHAVQQIYRRRNLFFCCVMLQISISQTQDALFINLQPLQYERSAVSE